MMDEEIAMDIEKSSSERLLPAFAFDSDERRVIKPAIKGRWKIHACYLSALFCLLLYIFVGTSIQASTTVCMESTNAWSPALSSVLPYQDVRFVGTLDAPSPFRGKPSPQVDAAWETVVRMLDDEGFGISDDEFLRLGLPLDENVVRLNASQGGGILASLEAFHQLHCLNLIRQYTYPEYYQSRALTFQDPPEMLRTHVDHCIEMLRQKLMCDADAGVVTHTWVSRRRRPWPNFNVRHQCRNWDGLVKWSIENQAPNLHTYMWRPDHIKGLDPPP